MFEKVYLVHSEADIEQEQLMSDVADPKQLSSGQTDQFEQLIALETQVFE